MERQRAGRGAALPRRAASTGVGREPSTASGDVLGLATHTPNAGGERALVLIYPYFGAAVPASIAGWFLQAFPDAELRKTSS